MGTQSEEIFDPVWVGIMPAEPGWVVHMHVRARVAGVTVDNGGDPLIRMGHAYYENDPGGDEATLVAWGMTAEGVAHPMVLAHDRLVPIQFEHEPDPDWNYEMRWQVRGPKSDPCSICDAIARGGSEW